MTDSLQTKALSLHARLGDPKAPSEILETFEKQLSSVVSATVPKLVDPGDVNAAVADALLRYFKAPSQYDPSRAQY